MNLLEKIEAKKVKKQKQDRNKKIAIAKVKLCDNIQSTKGKVEENTESDDVEA
ncbi:hypothetical protein lbkm_2430 [Lachnospiraceae bacterium KM106-2]|nr:hypothetical protein lbkm_2430 [Lachnospiraceae bacterium KM106-2]